MYTDIEYKPGHYIIELQLSTDIINKINAFIERQETSMSSTVEAILTDYLIEERTRSSSSERGNQ